MLLCCKNLPLFVGAPVRLNMLNMPKSACERAASRTEQWRIQEEATLCLKKRRTSEALTCYSLDVHCPITIIFGSCVTEKVRNRTMLCLPTSLSGVSALPCERGNPEDSAPVHCACIMVQLLERCRLPFSWTMPPKAPSWTHWLWDLGSHAAAWVWLMSQKHWRNQAATGWILAMH